MKAHGNQSIRSGAPGWSHIAGSIEYAWAEVGLHSPKLRSLAFGEEASTWMRCLGPAWTVLFRPRRTINLYGELSAQLQYIAAQRDGAGDIDAEAQRFLLQKGVQFKNAVGPVVIMLMTPKYQKVVANYWTAEKTRSALEARLRKGI